MKKKQQRIFFMLLMGAGFLAFCVNSAVALDDTTLFVTLDSSWEHASEGDTFVVRADVKNIGQNPALITWVRLENIPADWNVQPPQNLMLVLEPNQTQSCFFVVQRGATDATVYATADAYNAPVVQSNRIAIPVSLWVVVGISLVCGIVVYKEVNTRKKQGK
jgi:hypothetical protein